MVGSTKGKEYFTKIKTDNITASALNTELGTASNLTDFIYMLSFASVRDQLFSKESSYAIIADSAIASVNSIYQKHFLTDGTEAHICSPVSQVVTSAGTYVLGSVTTISGNNAIVCPSFTRSAFYTRTSSSTQGVEFFRTNMLNYSSGSIGSPSTLERTQTKQGGFTVHAGYMAGGRGDSSGSETASIDRFTFATEAYATGIAAMGDGRKEVATCQNINDMYTMGGHDNTVSEVNIDKMAKSSETVTTNAATLSAGVRNGSGTEDNTYGFLIGGNQGTDTVKLLFSSDTVSASTSIGTADSAMQTLRSGLTESYLYGGTGNAGTIFKWDSSGTPTVTAVNISGIVDAIEGGNYGM